MTVEVSQDEFKKILRGWKGGRRNKYNARKVEVDDYTFDSQAEATRYGELKLLQRAGEIRDLAVHPKFVLQYPFEDRWGRKWKAVTYTADFQYFEGELCVVEDVKGGKVTQTRSFRDKASLFQSLHPDIQLRIEVR